MYYTTNSLVLLVWYCSLPNVDRKNMVPFLARGLTQ